MAEFLTTIGTSYYIERIILDARESLILVTPYLSLSKNLIDRLKDADRNNIKTTLIYGKNELSEKERKKIESFKNIEIYFCENLHAKCYLNEESLIITSMNLYEFSERNNREMGIFINKDDDSKIYEDTLKEIESIKNASKKERANENEEQNLIYLSDDKKDSWNFHLPSLYRVLKQEIVIGYNMSYKTDIIIEKYPFKGIDIDISYRVDFNFEDRIFFNYLKDNYKLDIMNDLWEERVYWNNKCINVYLKKGLKIEVNQECLEKLVDIYIRIITVIRDRIIEANEKFRK